MISVTDMDYPTAVKALNDAGFSNIVSNISSDADESLWVVTSQSKQAGKKLLPDTKIELECAMKCSLYLDISSEGNLLFSTYDISISLDGTEIGTVANGKEFTYLAPILSGDHELVFCKAGNTSPKGTKTLSVSGDMTYTCTLSHDHSSIGLKNESTESNVGMASLEAVDVTGMVLSDAMKTLEDIGFSNLREEPNSKIWDKNNWIVVSQGISAGTVVDKNEYFQLDCISLDDYFSQTYVGRDAAEIQELAEQSGFTIRFEDSSGEDLNNKIADLDDDRKKDWVATSAFQYVGTGKTAVVEMEYKGVVPEATEQESAASEKETSTQQTETASVDNSTNSESSSNGASDDGTNANNSDTSTSSEASDTVTSASAEAGATVPQVTESDNATAGENTQEYVLNTNTMVFHYPGCRAVKKMNDTNKLIVNDTRDDIINQGYKPCGICKP